MSSTQHFIRTRLSVRPVPTLPTIRLFQAGPESGLSQRRGAKAPPYWAFVWGGGLALARYLIDHPSIVAGRCVLDLGAGSGLVGIAAAKAGASRILAADVDPDALVAIALNAAENEVEIVAIAEDLTLASRPPVDVVLVGDLFYERSLAQRVETFLDRSAARGARFSSAIPGENSSPVRVSASLWNIRASTSPRLRAGRSIAFTHSSPRFGGSARSLRLEHQLAALDRKTVEPLEKAHAEQALAHRAGAGDQRANVAHHDGPHRNPVEPDRRGER